jgi:hypothetical protein
MCASPYLRIHSHQIFQSNYEPRVIVYQLFQWTDFFGPGDGFDDIAASNLSIVFRERAKRAKTKVSIGK